MPKRPTSHGARVLFLWPLVFAMLTAACSGTSSSTTAAKTSAGANCSIPPRTYSDLEACDGNSTEIELTVAKSFDGKTTAKIAIASRDPRQILSAMGAYTKEWSTGADSFTVLAFGAETDPESGAGYNRGRIYWNNGGEITVNLCTKT